MSAQPGQSPANKGKKYPAEPLTEGEVNALIKACSNRAPTGVRNRALIIVLYRGGLRIAEALLLKPKDVDVDVDTGAVRVLRGKGEKARTVAIDPASVAVVQRWLEVRSNLGIRNNHALFCTLAGGSTSAPYVRQMLKRMALRAGIEKRVTPHNLRHTMAAQLAAEGVPINVIQRALGHSNAATTSRYLDHIAPQQVIDAMRARIWKQG